MTPRHFDLQIRYSGGLAAGRLLVGDVIVSLNGVAATAISHDVLLALLKAAATVVLEVQRPTGKR